MEWDMYALIELTIGFEWAFFLLSLIITTCKAQKNLEKHIQNNAKINIWTFYCQMYIHISKLYQIIQ